MPVAQLKPVTMRSLHEAIEQHCADDLKEFKAVRDEMATDAKRTHDQLDVLIRAFGLSKHDDKKPAAGLMSKKEWFWKLAGAMGGLLVLDKILIAIGPMTVSFVVSIAKIVAGIH